MPFELARSWPVTSTRSPLAKAARLPSRRFGGGQSGSGAGTAGQQQRPMPSQKAERRARWLCCRPREPPDVLLRRLHSACERRWLLGACNQAYCILWASGHSCCALQVPRYPAAPSVPALPQTTEACKSLEKCFLQPALGGKAAASRGLAIENSRTTCRSIGVELPVGERRDSAAAVMRTLATGLHPSAAADVANWGGALAGPTGRASRVCGDRCCAASAGCHASGRHRRGHIAVVPPAVESRPTAAGRVQRPGNPPEAARRSLSSFPANIRSGK